MEIVLIGGAVAGAIGMLSAPDGSNLGWTTGTLAGTPFEDYVVPGLTLLLANGVLPTIVVIATLRRQDWAGWGHLVVGCVLTGWIGVQVLLIGYLTVLQPIFGALGVAIALLGVATIWRRREPQGAVPA